jgi:hypothetical protein
VGYPLYKEPIQKFRTRKNLVFLRSRYATTLKEMEHLLTILPLRVLALKQLRSMFCTYVKQFFISL